MCVIGICDNGTLSVLSGRPCLSWKQNGTDLRRSMDVCEINTQPKSRNTSRAAETRDNVTRAPRLWRGQTCKIRIVAAVQGAPSNPTARILVQIWGLASIPGSVLLHCGAGAVPVKGREDALFEDECKGQRWAIDSQLTCYGRQFQTCMDCPIGPFQEEKVPSSILLDCIYLAAEDKAGIGKRPLESLSWCGGHRRCFKWHQSACDGLLGPLCVLHRWENVFFI